MMDARLAATSVDRAAVVWLDPSHALVARSVAGHAAVTEVSREADAEAVYMLRIMHRADDCDRLVVMGPDASRVAFEREYVALHHRPDRLIDVGQVETPRGADMMDTLRILEPSVAAAHA